jgi:hypothetical protein
MVKVTVLACADEPGEREALEAWIKKWEEQIPCEIENSGCGCCVDIYDLIVPEAAIQDLPEHLRCTSAWSEVDPLAR